MENSDPREEGLVPEFEAPLSMQWPVRRTPRPYRKPLRDRLIDYWRDFDPLDAAETLLRNLRSIRELGGWPYHP